MADRLERIRSRFSYVRCKDAVLDRTGFKRYSFPPSRSFPRLVYSSLDPTLFLSLSLEERGSKIQRDRKTAGSAREERNEIEGKDKKKDGESDEHSTRHYTRSPLHLLSVLFIPLYSVCFLSCRRCFSSHRLARNLDRRIVSTTAKRLYRWIKAFLRISSELYSGTWVGRWSFGETKNPWQKRHCAILLSIRVMFLVSGIFGKFIKSFFFFLSFWYRQVFQAIVVYKISLERLCIQIHLMRNHCKLNLHHER